MIVVTGATGQLGKLVVESLLHSVPANQIVAAVRNPSKAADMAAKGVQVREADYSRPETLAKAFVGASKLLLISSNELGQRESQHKVVIDAAKAAGVKLLAYTSLLRADTTKMLLAAEHLATEEYLRASGIPFVMLRNGWYIENFTAGLAPALQQGAYVGSSKDGRFAAASRADYAAAAAVVLAGSGHENKVYELAGDDSFTRTELAAETSRQTGKSIVYHDLPEAEYMKILSSFLPSQLARVLADSDVQAASGALDDSSHTLSGLIGRKTTPMAKVLAAAFESQSKNLS